MTTLHRATISFILLLFLVACRAEPALDPTATPEPVPVATDTPVVVDTATPVPTETAAPTPTPEPTETPTPVPTPEVTVEFVEYTSEFAGLTLSHPEEWALFDFFFVIIASRQDILDLMMDSALTDDALALESGAILIAIAGATEEFNITDPLELLDEFADEAEDIEIVEGPTEIVINGQNASRLLVRARADDMELMILSVVIHSEEFGRSAALLGMTPVEGAEEFLPLLEAIIESAELLAESALD